jgi:hypothetical protein
MHQMSLDMKKRKVGVLSSVGECYQKKVRLHDAKTNFIDHVHNAPISATDHTTSKMLMFENCNSLPCDWTERGPGILQYLSNEYVGQYIDDDGHLYDEFAEGA